MADLPPQKYVFRHGTGQGNGEKIVGRNLGSYRERRAGIGGGKVEELRAGFIARYPVTIQIILIIVAASTCWARMFVYSKVSRRENKLSRQRTD
jgi:hypothetical protein